MGAKLASVLIARVREKRERGLEKMGGLSAQLFSSFPACTSRSRACSRQTALVRFRPCAPVSCGAVQTSDRPNKAEKAPRLHCRTGRAVDGARAARHSVLDAVFSARRSQRKDMPESCMRQRGKKRAARQ